MNCKKFYIKTKEYLEDKASKQQIADLELYFSPEVMVIPKTISKKTFEEALYRLAFHAQNAGMKRNSIQFKKEVNSLNKVFCGFNPEQILKEYQNPEDLYKKIDSVLPELKHKGEDPKRYVRYQYAKSIISSCQFLMQYSSWKEFYKHMKSLGEVAPLYLSVMIDGFDIALSCDFLKEYGILDCAKPDVHIVNILLELNLLDKCQCKYNKRGNVEITQKIAYQAIMVMQKLAQDISEKVGETISAYQLDRMLWLICTENFFNDSRKENNSSKKRDAYISYIKTECNIA